MGGPGALSPMGLKGKGKSPPGTPGGGKGGTGYQSKVGPSMPAPPPPGSFGKGGPGLPPGPPRMMGGPPGMSTLDEQRQPLKLTVDNLNGPGGPGPQLSPPSKSRASTGGGALGSVSALKYLSPRAIVQIFLTVLCMGSSIVSFIFAVILNQSLVSDLTENQDGNLKSDILPCIRSVLPVCGNNVDDKCWDRCCPPGYICQRSPVVGLYCQDGNNVCGGGAPDKFSWCSDYADIPGVCQTEVCKKRDLVHALTIPVFTVTGIALFMDLVDLVMFFAAPDNVQFKAALNLGSSMTKWIAFSLLLGGGTQNFISDLYDNQCYNTIGMTQVQSTGEYMVSFVATVVVSALLSLILAPMSAYYGGKLMGVPYVK